MTLSTFGYVTHDSPLDMPSEELTSLLSQYGAIQFKGTPLSNDDIISVMSKIGVVQTFTEQQAPKSDTDPANHYIINLHNNDFLGNSRTSWHMDQTFSNNTYLPVRSLYCSYVNSTNITEFADIKYLTGRVINDYPILNYSTTAEYKIGPASNTRPIFSFCDHVGRWLLRYDNRMNFKDTISTDQFKKYCTEILNGTEIPKLSVEWQLYDFVIFDNNQAPHRRALMEGECRLKRSTSKFWLNK